MQLCSSTSVGSYRYATDAVLEYCAVLWITGGGAEWSVFHSNICSFYSLSSKADGVQVRICAEVTAA